MRRTLAISALGLVTGAVLARLTYDHIQASTLVVTVAAVGVLLLMIPLVHRPARRLDQLRATVGAGIRGAAAVAPQYASGGVGIVARCFKQVASKAGRQSTGSSDGDARGFAPAQSGPSAQREEILVGVVESASWPIISETLDGTITAWNAAAERLYKYTAAEAIGSNIEIVIPPDRREERQAIHDWALADKPIENFETIRMAKDGRRIDVSVSIYTVKSGSGAIVGVATITRDITARKFAEEKFRQVVESCPSGMIMADSTGSVVMVNTEVERMFGYRREDLIGQPVDVLVPDRFRARHFHHRFDYYAKPESRRMGGGRDLFALRKDGTEFPVEVGLTPIHTREGLLILSVIVDISERKHAEEMFRLAVEACPSGMVIIDRGGRLVMVNTEIERMFGYERGALIGQPVDILVPERLRQQHMRHRNEFVTGPQTRRMGAGRDLFGLRKNGTEFPVEVGLNPIRMGHGLLVLAVIVDITERKRLERLKDEFVSTVSHELRTPLTSIFSSLGLLVANAGGSLPDTARRLLSIAYTNSQRLVRLVNDILDIEKMESGQVAFNLSAVDVRSLVEQAIEANRGLAQSYRVNIRLDCAAAGQVRADPDRLSQVVTNLISNAIKFSPEDGDIVVAVERQGDTLRLSVRDHGPGIAADFKPRIFEKFAQADGTNARKMGGTGLGLSIVKQIVERLGGKVGFADAPGGGTIFHVDLPCWEELTRRPKVLHVQSDGSSRDVTRALAGVADVTSVSSIDAAREALTAHHFELAILDAALAAGFGSDPQSSLHDREGNAIPVVIFAHAGESPAGGEQAQTMDPNSPRSIENLLAAVRDRLPQTPRAFEELA